MARVFVIILLLTVAQVALAAEPALNGDDFVPIAPIPMGQSGELATSDGLSEYINALFTLAIAAGSALAAIYIAIGGFEYIFSEAMESKKNGRLRIVNALTGLAILLVVTMVLYIINPDLITLRLLSLGGASWA